MKNKAVHNNRMSGHDGTEEDVDGDWVDENNAAVGEGGGGLGQKTKEATVSEDGGNPTQIPKKAIFFFDNRCSCEKKEPGIMPSGLWGRHLHGSPVRAHNLLMVKVSLTRLL